MAQRRSSSLSSPIRKDRDWLGRRLIADGFRHERIGSEGGNSQRCSSG